MASESLGNGRYVVRGVLGEGAQGTTYEAVTADGRVVAIKKFDVRGARGWKDVELAEREARVLSTLDHPLVPRYIEHFEDDGSLYLVMEKIEGETLDAIRKREGVFSEAEVRRFLADADRALTYLHGRASPIVHRDIKPRNVVRRPNGSYVLVDFGAVSELLLRRGGASTVVGTMGYMAPEQFQGRAQPATDVYAVGATAVAALTGCEPETLPHQGLRLDVRTALQGRVSPALVASLEHMMEPDPDRRATSLASALDAVRSQAPSHGPPGMTAMSSNMAPMMPMQHHGVLQYGMAPAAQGRPPLDPHEDAIVKSIRKLLWVLWGLSWIIVPVTLGQLHAQRLIPIVMFGALALIFIVTWHKGAMIRAFLQAFGNPRPNAVPPQHAPRVQASAPPPPYIGVGSSMPHQRVETGPNAQVRVHTGEASMHDLEGQTERSDVSSSLARQARRP